MSYLHLDVEKIYIIHYDKNVDRKTYIQNYLSKYDNVVEFCTFPNREELSPELILKYYNKNVDILSERSNKFNRAYFENMSLVEISVAICHFITLNKAMREIDNRCLILEDDVIFNDNFDNFNSFLKSTPPDFDCIFIGNGANLHADAIDDRIAYIRNNNVTRCTDSIIYTKKMINEIVSNYTSFMQPIDWEMELILRELNAIVYWWEPTIVSQGSQTGIYESNIR